MLRINNYLQIQYGRKFIRSGTQGICYHIFVHTDLGWNSEQYSFAELSSFELVQNPVQYLFVMQLVQMRVENSTSFCYATHAGSTIFICDYIYSLV